MIESQVTVANVVHADDFVADAFDSTGWARPPGWSATFGVGSWEGIVEPTVTFVLLDNDMTNILDWEYALAQQAGRIGENYVLVKRTITATDGQGTASVYHYLRNGEGDKCQL